MDHDSATSLPQPCPGFHFAKLGTSNLIQANSAVPPASSSWWQRWREWYYQLPQDCQGVLVAYADSAACEGLDVDAALGLARQYHLPYVLVDTFDKSAGGLFAILRREDRLPHIKEWIDRAKQQGTHLALAGQLSFGDVRQLATWQAEIVGVRSAVCEQDEFGTPLRAGDLCPDRLQQLLEAIDRFAPTARLF